MTVQEVITEFFSVAPKIAAFEAGQPVSIAIPAASYEIDVPNVGKIKVAESGTTVSITKG